MQLEKTQFVLKAARLPVSLVPADLADEMLFWVTNGVRLLILGEPHVLAEDASARAILIALENLEAAIATFPTHIGPRPPPVPSIWQSQIKSWEREVTIRRHWGRPVRPQQNALKLLCSLFRIVFACEPSGDRHTLAFIQAWWTIFGPEMQEAASHSERPMNRSLKIAPWAQPSDDALRKALKTIKYDEEVDRQILSALHEKKTFRFIREIISTNQR